MLVLAQRRVNRPLLRRDVTVDDGEVFFFNSAIFPDFAQLTSRLGIFCHDDHAAGLAVKAVDQMSRRATEVQAHAADEAGILVAFRGMADQARRFVNYQQVGILMDHLEKFLHRAHLSSFRAGVSSPAMKGKFALPLALMLVFALSRMPGMLPQNFSAAYALAFCAGVYFAGRMAWWLPLTVLFVTDIGLNCYYESLGWNAWEWSVLKYQLFNYLAYVALIWLGRRFKPKSSFVSLLGGGLLGALLFYLITNTASWLFNPFGNPEYTKTLAGWIIALTKGTGGWPDTWEFFRNTILSGGIFTALFAAAMKLSAPAESPADKKAGAREEEPEAEAEPKEVAG